MFQSLWRIFRKSSHAAHPADAPVKPMSFEAVWWKMYPMPTFGVQPIEPSPSDRPDGRFVVGAVVRLRGKPDRARKVLMVEWHRFRGQYVYIVETARQPTWPAYWFAAQLVPA